MRLSERYGEIEYRGGRVIQRSRGSSGNVRLSHLLMSFLVFVLWLLVEEGWSDDVGGLGEWPVCHCLFSIFVFYAKPTGRTVRHIWTNEIVPHKVVPFGALNDVSLNFCGQPPKNWNLGAWIGLWSLNDKKWKALELENYLADHHEIFAGGTHHEWAYMGVPWLSNKSNMADSGQLEFREMLIFPQRIKISVPNAEGRCTTVMRRWPHDQRSKPEINPRDVTK